MYKTSFVDIISRPKVRQQGLIQKLNKDLNQNFICLAEHADMTSLLTFLFLNAKQSPTSFAFLLLINKLREERAYPKSQKWATF